MDLLKLPLQVASRRSRAPQPVEGGWV